jgi:hypothetical protein
MGGGWGGGVHERVDRLAVLHPLRDRAAQIHLLGVADLCLGGEHPLADAPLLRVRHQDRAGRSQVLGTQREFGVGNIAPDRREHVFLGPLPYLRHDKLPRLEGWNSQVVHDVIDVVMAVDLLERPLKAAEIAVILHGRSSQLLHLPRGALLDRSVNNLRAKEGSEGKEGFEQSRRQRGGVRGVSPDSPFCDPLPPQTRCSRERAQPAFLCTGEPRNRCI